MPREEQIRFLSAIPAREAASRLEGMSADLRSDLFGSLPLITELLRHNAPQLMLLQQSEVHLHPSAAAAVGSLLRNCCATKAGASRQQIVVETHSDFIIDRVRVAVRDDSTGLLPQDVSILYFRREEQAVRIHSISVDRLGNIEGAPAGYRRFFMEELGHSMSA